MPSIILIPSDRLKIGQESESVAFTPLGTDALVLRLTTTQVGEKPSQATMHVRSDEGRNLGSLVCDDGETKRVTIDGHPDGQVIVQITCNLGEVVAGVVELTALDAVIPETDKIAGVAAALPSPSGSLYAISGIATINTSAAPIDFSLNSIGVGMGNPLSLFHEIDADGWRSGGDTLTVPVGKGGLYRITAHVVHPQTSFLGGSSQGDMGGTTFGINIVGEGYDVKAIDDRATIVFRKWDFSYARPLVEGNVVSLRYDGASIQINEDFSVQLILEQLS